MSKSSEAQKRLWADPEVRRRRVEGLRLASRKVWNDLDRRRVQAEKTKASWADPAIRASRIAGMEAAHKRRKGTTSGS